MNSKFETNFPLQHQQKDLRLAIDMADSVDQPMHVIAAANEVGKVTSEECTRLAVLVSRQARVCFISF